MIRNPELKAPRASSFISQKIIVAILFLSVSGFFYTQRLMASEIVYLGKSFAVIDAGSGQGLKVGSKVCFDPEDGMDSLCGIVRVVRKRLCGVKIPRAEISRLSVGLEVYADDLVEAPEQKKMSKKELKKFINEIEKVSPIPVPVPAPDPDPKIEEPEQPKPAAVEPPSWRFSLAWIVSPLRNYRYRLPSYSLENEVTGEGELWTGEAIPAFAPFTFEVEFARLDAMKSGLSLGIRRQALIADVVLASYSAIDSSEKLEGQIDASALGLSMEWQENFVLAEGLSLSFHSGIDIEESKVEVTQTLSNGAGQLTQLQSRLLVLSPRAGGDIFWRFFSVDWRIGMTLLLPVVSKGTKAQVNMNTKSDASPEQAANADRALVLALGHDKTSFGLQLLFGASRSF